MVYVISFLKEILPTLVSLISVFVAGYAVRMNKRIARDQAFFSQKAKAYDDFLKAFSAVVYDHTNNGKRDALTQALYSACLYAQKPLQSKMSNLANQAFAAQTHQEFVALEAKVQDLLDDLSDDLRRYG